MPHRPGCPRGGIGGVGNGTSSQRRKRAKQYLFCLPFPRKRKRDIRLWRHAYPRDTPLSSNPTLRDRSTHPPSLPHPAQHGPHDTRDSAAEQHKTTKEKLQSSPSPPPAGTRLSEEEEGVGFVAGRETCMGKYVQPCRTAGKSYYDTVWFRVLLVFLLLVSLKILWAQIIIPIYSHTHDL